jgi:hypothetical protein
VDDEEHVAMKDRPRDALRDPAEVFGWISAGMVEGDLDEEVDRHTQQDLDDEKDHGPEELIAQALALSGCARHGG